MKNLPDTQSPHDTDTISSHKMQDFMDIISPKPSSQKFSSQHDTGTISSPKAQDFMDIMSSKPSSQKFSSQHDTGTISSPKAQDFMDIMLPKPSSQKFSSQHDTGTISSLKIQDYRNIMSPKKKSLQKSISYTKTMDEITPIKTPTTINLNVYSPNMLLSSQKFDSPKLSRNNNNVNLSKMSGHFVKKQLFKSKESGTHSAPSKKTSSMLSTNTRKSKFLTDDQFKDMVSHNLIIMKHSIRNLNEKLDLLIERSSKSQNSNMVHEDDIDYTNLNCIFPIEDVNTLNDIEEQLASDKTYHKLMTNKLVGLGGKSIKIYIKRVMQLLFTDELLKCFSFNGRANKKKCFSNLIISKLIFSSIKIIKKFNYDGAIDDAEKYIKNSLIQAPFNIKKKSTSSAAAVITSPQQ